MLTNRSILKLEGTDSENGSDELGGIRNRDDAVGSRQDGADRAAGEGARLAYSACEDGLELAREGADDVGGRVRGGYRRWFRCQSRIGG
jgi:hypothetical protein